METLKRFDEILGAIHPVAQPSQNGLAQGRENAAPTPGSREDMYQRWADMEAMAARQSAELAALANQYEKGAGSAGGSALRAAANEMAAGHAELQQRRAEIMAEIASSRHELDMLKTKLAQLEKEKKTYDIMRWIPVVGLFSEIIAAINDTRNQCEMLTRRIRELEDYLRRIEREMARQQQMQWEKRAAYCQQMCTGLRRLIDAGADDSEIQNFLAENPPRFAQAT